MDDLMIKVHFLIIMVGSFQKNGSIKIIAFNLGMTWHEDKNTFPYFHFYCTWYILPS